MASRGYMGPNEVQALIGQWVDLVGRDRDDDDKDKDRKKQEREHDHDRKQDGRGSYGQQDSSQWWLNPPPWWRGNRNDWQRYPQWYQYQIWFQQQQQQQQPQYGYPSGQQPPVYPYPQPQQQPPYRPDDRVLVPPQGTRPGFTWVPAQGSTPGHYVRNPAPVVRDHRTSGYVGAWSDLVGPGVGADLPAGAFPFPPLAAVVEAPPPTQANRDILPMSTGVPILPTQSAQITGRPQVLAYRCGRFLISNAGTAGGAADWIVNDIKIGNRSQFVQSGDVPGDLFAVNAIDTFVRFETAQTAMDVVVVVTYIGLNESGCPFFGAMIGTAAI